MTQAEDDLREQVKTRDACIERLVKERDKSAEEVKALKAAATTPHFDRVVKFIGLAGQEGPPKPAMPSEEIRLLRARLILEEALETILALGFRVREHEEISGELEVLPYCAPNLAGIADGCADVMVVTTGTLAACGIPDVALLEIVDSNNLAKFGPGGYRRGDGKWVKPADHKPPDIAGLLEKLGGTK